MALAILSFMLLGMGVYLSFKVSTHRDDKYPMNN
ncbi:hypothetical protein J2Y60_004671 [Arcicella sp. BE140]|nr:hypothetical protein [Arcicella sp. BE51]MDR6814453.1 hypothetical protein [Arcicella sp. BE140]MDR6825791.1 hypothetical protein [Arcicella sp. BE139]